MARPAPLLLLALALAPVTSAPAAAVKVVTRDPAHLVVRLTDVTPGTRYRVTYRNGKRQFVWENLAPDASGAVTLTDDSHLRPEYRLRCESRTSAQDPVVFDDFTKGTVLSRRRQPFGVPVSTFGGPGYLVPGLSSLVRDPRGNFWLYFDHPPYALLKYDAKLLYQFALLLPGKALAFDTDGEGNVWVLHPGNWLSKHGPTGQVLGAWELPSGRKPGEFSLASGLVIDRENGLLYLADEVLGRVQRFDLELNLQPIPAVMWGWIGREDLGYTRAGEYDPERMYYALDRPRDLRLDGAGHLFVSCEHYVSKFDLGTGKQLPFGAAPVLGWGGTFSDSAFSSAAGTDGHWQRHYLAGVDTAGRLYVADRDNEFVPDQRLQVFASDGKLERVFSVGTEVKDARGERVYLGAVAGVACAEDGVWLADAAGHIYESRGGLRDGGIRYLGPGAAGRQFDLSKAEEAKFTAEAQSQRVRHTSEGKVLAFSGSESSTRNCEREGVSLLRHGERSLWLPTRLGEPFTVKLLGADGQPIPESGYRVEYEERPGAFGNRYDFFRVTNNSGADWTGATFVATAKE